jgi:uncharacterized protein YfbU (UPF0304 family)
LRPEFCDAADHGGAINPQDQTRKNMQLSKQDRVLLAGQFRILERLAPEEECFSTAAEILEHGFTPLYSDIMGSLREPALSEDECRLVLDILKLCREIEAYTRSNPSDRQVARHPWAEFRGFDGEREADYLALARFLLQDGAAESRHHGAGAEDFDSHTPTLSKYRHMLAIRKAQTADAVISREGIREILELGKSGTEAAPATGGVASWLKRVGAKVFDFLTSGGEPVEVPTVQPKRRKPAAQPAAAIKKAMTPAPAAMPKAPETQPEPAPAVSSPPAPSAAAPAIPTSAPAPVPAPSLATAEPKPAAAPISPKPEPTAAAPAAEAEPAPRTAPSKFNVKLATSTPRPAANVAPSAKPRPARSVRTEAGKPVAKAAPAKAAAPEPKASRPAAKPNTGGSRGRGKPKRT